MPATTPLGASAGRLQAGVWSSGIRTFGARTGGLPPQGTHLARGSSPSGPGGFHQNVSMSGWLRRRSRREEEEGVSWPLDAHQDSQGVFGKQGTEQPWRFGAAAPPEPQKRRAVRGKGEGKIQEWRAHT